MTKKEFKRIYKQLDINKFDLLRQGLPFDFIAITDGDFAHTGIGDGETMSYFAVVKLYDLFQIARQGTTKEDFIESVKRSFLEYCRFREENPDAASGYAFQIHGSGK